MTELLLLAKARRMKRKVVTVEVGDGRGVVKRLDEEGCDEEGGDR